MPVNRPGTKTLAGACGAHVIHDGFSDLLYLLLPFWQREFGLSLAQVGLLKTIYSGAMAGFQIPAAFIAERLGERPLLVLGTVVSAAGFILFGAAGGFISLIAILVLAGLASGVQHPLSSSLISRAIDPSRVRIALGTYNFFGDVGKVILPAAAALLIAGQGWRFASVAVGILGLGAAFLLLLALSAPVRPTSARRKEPPLAIPSPPAQTANRTNRVGFGALSAIGVLDGGTRTGFLTFLPFLLTEKQAEPEVLGLALALVFVGGAIGKFVCGMIAAKVGIIRTVIITETATAAGILVLIPVSLTASLLLLPLVGIALNGTSSVLYGTVADLVPAERRARGFGLFYTVTIGAGASAPLLYGLLSDTAGLERTLEVMASVVLLILPLTLVLRRALRATARGSVAAA